MVAERKYFTATSVLDQYLLNKYVAISPKYRKVFAGVTEYDHRGRMPYCLIKAQGGANVL